MMRVMVALALPALASGATCSQAVCCTGITGMCKGNADAATDVTCPANTINVGGAGTTTTICCEDACLADVCAAADVVTKADFAAIVGITQAECCDDVVTGMCSGNTDENAVAKVADDHSCTAGILIAASAATIGATDDLCCGTACLASVCTAGFSTKADFATIVGDTTAECCDVTGMCNGNTLATADFVCSATSSDKAATLCTPAVKEATSGAATATVAASALALVAALL